MNNPRRHLESRRPVSLPELLDEIARRGSWFGGGSVAAISAALAAALLEKLTVEGRTARALRRRRLECLHLTQRDAHLFSQVIRATRLRDRRAFRRALKQATEIPCRIAQHALALEAVGRVSQRVVRPKLRSDLRCALALARASGAGANALIETNLLWLGDPRYASRTRRRLRAAANQDPRHGA